MGTDEKINQLLQTMPEHQRAQVLHFIEHLHQSPSKVALGPQALEILERNGFIGCGEGDGTFSVNYSSHSFAQFPENSNSCDILNP